MFCFYPSGRTVGPIVIKFEMVPFEVKLVISYKFEQNRMNQISVVPKKPKLALFPYCFAPSGRTVGSIVIKFEMVPFEVELVISHKFEQNRMNQISAVPKKARIGPF